MEVAKASTFDDSETFVVLGANMTSSYDNAGGYNETQRKRHWRFIRLMRQLHGIDPQLAFTLTRLSGYPRLNFYASVTPPDFSGRVLLDYQDSLIDYLQEKLNFIVPAEAVHNRFGLGVPDYYSYEYKHTENTSQVD